MRLIWHGMLVLALTVLSQLGGLAWLVALRFRRRVLVFLIAYSALMAGAQVVAPVFGRVPLPCQGEVLRMQSVFYCLTLRNFVTPEMLEVAADARVGKVFVEPPPATRLGVAGPKIRFQDCRAARHDDHIHVQL
jgi:hypothetical protein